MGETIEICLDRIDLAFERQGCSTQISNIIENMRTRIEIFEDQLIADIAALVIACAEQDILCRGEMASGHPRTRKVRQQPVLLVQPLVLRIRLLVRQSFEKPSSKCYEKAQKTDKLILKTAMRIEKRKEEALVKKEMAARERAKKEDKMKDE
ncbi:uncharacterized protein KD926_003210 [Aspergillus affinis]|uniref:uncharacterized protein n=1 Tax=Aspergillus affinis TaxID=1070780 RepID=UPI0022FF012E|nr:uncharacterized protein KD926_003210 [Aspergillus affinis]KAI9035606.1 hypothetical protein KD926_003210 [Aspergillus affinis]